MISSFVCSADFHFYQSYWFVYIYIYIRPICAISDPINGFHELIKFPVDWFIVLRYVLILPHFVNYTSKLSELIKLETRDTHGKWVERPLFRIKLKANYWSVLTYKNIPGHCHISHGINCGKQWIIIDLNNIGNYKLTVLIFHSESGYTRMHIRQIKLIPLLYLGKPLCQ